ncbi:MAG: phosphoglucosamine mutase [Alphaproteobacteria bacterium]|nr:MAG: phosphoglucosamine mutase [Alphaproteobacteria bacterium]
MTQRQYFGTDGIRGKANEGSMTPEIATRVAMAAAYVLSHQNGNPRRGHKRVLIGKDTRLSGYLIEPALTAGFISAGMDVLLVGPMPTPAIAHLTNAMRCDLGVMISASHNPFQDNGIKLFGPDGYKLSDAKELEIEAAMNLPPEQLRAKSEDLGRAQRLDDALGRYIEFAKATFPNDLRLDGLRVVVDCANGAAYKAAPTVLWELGAEVITIGTKPDGLNINKDCGAVHPEAMQEQVVTHKADIGIALDGDADRLIVADELGQIVDGDQILAMIAESWSKNGRIKQKSVVATVMSNMGLEQFLQGLNLSLVRTKVGDRYVVEEMRSKDLNIGGEQSGHIVLSDYATTGDGLIAALQVLAVLVQSKQKASQICQRFKPYPQLLKNVSIANSNILDHKDVKTAIQAGEQTLGNKGRLLIRKSGTEPLLRVMAEGENQAILDKVVDDIIAAIKKAG